MDVRLTSCVCLAGSLLGLAAAGAATLGGDEDLTDGVLSYQGGSITGTLAGTTRTFSWSGVSNGLDLAGFNLTYTEGVAYHNFSNGKNLFLDLLNGTEYGAITNGGTISTVAEPAGQTGGITITNAGAITLAQLTCANPYGNSASSAGPIRVNNKGAFAAGSTASSALSNSSGAQSFTGDNTGTFTVAGAMDSSSGGTVGGSITINGYQSVTVSASLNASAAANSYGHAGSVLIGTLANPIDGTISIGGGVKTSGNTTTAAGNITMYAAGPITIAGAIDLDCPNSTDGALSLNTSRDIKLGALDLSRTVSATLNCGVSCLVTGVVASFSTACTGGGGVPLDPYVAIQTQLRAPAGKKVMYHPEVGGNAYLNGGSYRVADLNGNAGLGGILTPYQARGTVVLFK